MKKYLLYAGMFLGSFLVINVGMYFLLSATQPHTAMGSAADSLGTDSLAILHGDSTHAETDTTVLAHAEHGEAEVGESVVHQDSSVVSHADTTMTEHASEVAVERPVEVSEDKVTEQTAEVADADVPAGESAASTTDAPVSSKEIAKLAKMLEGMKPVEAAAIAERLPDETIVQLVLRMKSRAGAKMMAALPVPIAASVAARMAELSGVGG